VSLSRDLIQFLGEAGWRDAVAASLPGDASSRRYLRLRRADGRTAVLAIAPVGDAMTPRWLYLAERLRLLGISVPEIIHANPHAGLVLQEDLGEDSFAHLLDQGAKPAPLLCLAAEMLAAIANRFRAQEHGFGLPRFDRAYFLDQIALFADWHPPADRPAARQEFVAAWIDALDRLPGLPPTLLLRDCHAGNLFHRPQTGGLAACVAIDFQEAGQGPPLYDLVSLLEDARRDYPARALTQARARYRALAPPIGQSDFATGWAVLAAQRHTRVLGIFRRLAEQGRPEYSVHVPRVRRHLRRHLDHPALAAVARWFARTLPGYLDR
jgi:aminoglycoside/choline kinase family phosphotransferase